MYRIKERTYQCPLCELIIEETETSYRTLQKGSPDCDLPCCEGDSDE